MTQKTATSLIRPALEEVPNYKPGKPPAAVDGLQPYKLSSNEHFLPPISAVVEALTEVTNPATYPDPAAKALTAELANYLQVSEDHVAVGAGGSEIITALAHITLEAGSEVIYPWPSFELYPQASALNGAHKKPIGLTDDFGHDLPAMAQAITDDTRLILLCSPNNPTGPAVTADEFTTFMAQVPSDVLVVLDEAYWEFCTDASAVDSLAMLKHYENLVLMRTFSKAHALAGFRIGYAVGQPEVIAAVRKATVPFGVTPPSQHAAIVSLRHVDQVMTRAHSIAAARDEFVDALRAQGWNVPDSQANFVWLPLAEHSAAFEEACVKQSLAVRNLNSGVRISIGPPEAMDRVLNVAARFRQRHFSTNKV
ncbi:histidinol-phosphate transaminase [Yaniella flava]|uniref:Histidinol-phosphate aminotransferase n=1 Tax=Yaniella flava TaxID=287930 RepID=A0ABN2UCI4_9MICC